MTGTMAHAMLMRAQSCPRERLRADPLATDQSATAISMKFSAPLGPIRPGLAVAGAGSLREERLIDMQIPAGDMLQERQATQTADDECHDGDDADVRGSGDEQYTDTAQRDRDRRVGLHRNCAAEGLQHFEAEEPAAEHDRARQQTKQPGRDRNPD